MRLGHADQRQLRRQQLVQAPLKAGRIGQQQLPNDVAAWADLWFYGNPIFVEVQGSHPVAGVE